MMEAPGLQFILGKPLRGWLRRQGGVMRGWQRRYFVLQDNCLFCFNREDDTRVSHSYLLEDYQLKEIPSTADDPDKFVFELSTEKNNGESVMLCAATDEERKEWMKALTYHIYSGRGGAIFGMPLEVTMKYEHKQGRTIPYIVEACVEHLTTYAMEAEGIFRLAGRAGLLRELRGKFETGQHPALDSVDVHTVGSLLKAYLRELPESLVPPSLYQRAMNFAMRYAEASSGEIQISEVTGLSKLLQELPDVNYATLAYLCRFLHRLAANSEKTKMDTRNLSLVFGPNLIRHMDNNPELLMLTADLTQHLAFMLIRHCPDVLPSRPMREAINSEPAASSPVMRKNPAMQSVATADLLRLSQPVDSNDPSLLAPQPTRPTALGDLMGLDLSSQQDDVFGSSQSPTSPPSPFVFVSDYFDASSQSVSERGDGSTSSETSGGVGIVDRDLSRSPSFGTKPVPPKRTKSRTLRKRRPADATPPPLSPDPSRKLDSEDILKALATASHTTVNVSQSACKDSGAAQTTCKDDPSETRTQPAGDGKGTDNSVMSKTASSRYFLSADAQDLINKELNGEVAVSDPSSQIIDSICDERTASANSGSQGGSATEMEKLSPSQTVLATQVAVLKAELVNTKARSERLVSALKSQLTDMRSKYEARITTLEKQHQSQVMSLTAKLDIERNARAEAVERTVSLQTQLYKYKMQYGELRDSK